MAFDILGLLRSYAMAGVVCVLALIGALVIANNTGLLRALVDRLL
ncbi:hypothetical protein [Bradyrhizobium sp. SZCCHNRI1058]|nr:hypothetical protein [Bradyrhizobium sp. SZCCHNRI1058]